jgi:hypothetical protein
LTHIRTRFAVVALAILVPASLAGCFGGGGGSNEDPQQVLDQTFQNDQSVSSGVVDLSLSGSAGSNGNFSASLKGPFQGEPDNPAVVPQLDWTGTLTAEGAGQSINGSAGITITKDNLYVTYQDQAYELGTATFNQLKQAQEQAANQNGASSGQSFSEACKQAIQQTGGDTSACDIDFTTWLTNLSNEGTADVGGTTTIHIHGDANIKQILTDLGGLVQQAGGAAGAGVDPAQLNQAGEAVTSATIDLYSGESDHLLRKLDLSFTIDPSKLGAAAATPVPVGPIEVKFSLSLSDVNQPQTVSAPANAKPISGLSKLFGGSLGPLGSLGGSGLGSGSLPGGTGGGGSSSGGAYFKCVQQAAGDPNKINACAQKL